MCRELSVANRRAPIPIVPVERMSRILLGIIEMCA
jgi:hypothetical protein